MNDKQFEEMMEGVRDICKREIRDHMAKALNEKQSIGSIVNWIFENYNVEPGGTK